MSLLVLASTSPFRKTLLEKLHYPFICRAPETDETALTGESAQQLVQRLALAKAKAVSAEFDDALVIGSDQVAVLNSTIIGKPRTHQRAVEQLRASSGQCINFYTGLSLYDCRTATAETICEPYRVHFRNLDDQQIERYLLREQPYQCAGSFKSEGLGISLFERLEGEDPNTLVGLPLIRLIELLARQGITIP